MNNLGSRQAVRNVFDQCMLGSRRLWKTSFSSHHLIVAQKPRRASCWRLEMSQTVNNDRNSRRNVYRWPKSTPIPAVNPSKQRKNTQISNTHLDPPGKICWHRTCCRAKFSSSCPQRSVAEWPHFAYRPVHLAQAAGSIQCCVAATPPT